jgi:hypothetical protein
VQDKTEALGYIIFKEYKDLKMINAPVNEWRPVQKAMGFLEIG